MYLSLHSRCYWPSQYADCSAWYKGCHICQKNSSRKRQEFTIESHKIPPKVYEILAIDHFGPVNTKSEYKHVLLATDVFSQRTFFIKAKTTTGSEPGVCATNESRAVRLKPLRFSPPPPGLREMRVQSRGRRSRRLRRTALAAEALGARERHLPPGRSRRRMGALSWARRR